MKNGKIIIPAGRSPWPHELHVAKILARNGYKVEFILESNIKTPDIYLNGIEYEIKSPTTDNSKKVIRNIKRALEKCPNIIIDSTRIKNIKDNSIEKILKNKNNDLPKLKKIIFINKQEQIIDIK